MNNRPSYQCYLHVVLIIFVATTMALPLAILVKQKQSVTLAHLNRIKLGMTVKEIECVFGVQGGDFPIAGVGTLAWPIDDGAMIVIFFDNKRSAEWIFLYTPEETWLKKNIRLFAQPWQHQIVPEFPSPPEADFDPSWTAPGCYRPNFVRF